MVGVDPARRAGVGCDGSADLQAAGRRIYKLPDLAGHNGDGIRGQVLVGSICAGIAAYLSVRFLTRFFATRTLTPFAIYSLIVGIGMIVYLNV